MLHLSRREVFTSYNTLLCLAQGVTGEYTTIDLRNECFVTGKVDQVDGNMNIFLSDAIFTNQRGEEFKYDMFFVKERNIRYIHIPNSKSIKDTIDVGLKRLNIRKEPQEKKKTLKEKRALERQKETIAMIEKLKEERIKKEAQ